MASCERETHPSRRVASRTNERRRDADVRAYANSTAVDDSRDVSSGAATSRRTIVCASL